MADFSKLVITAQGQALIAKTLANLGDIAFTKICASDSSYDVSELETLSGITGIKQEALPSRIEVTNERAVQISCAFSNYDLTASYYLRTIGLYAQDPDEGEILYAACVDNNNPVYVPAYNGVTATGIQLRLITLVGNSDNVSLKISPAALVTHADIEDLLADVAHIKHMVLNNDYLLPLEAEAGFMLSDDIGSVILADWKYKVK